jgi:hypothetical protein
MIKIKKINKNINNRIHKYVIKFKILTMLFCHQKNNNLFIKFKILSHLTTNALPINFLINRYYNKKINSIVKI